MSNVVAGINEGELSNLSIEVQDYADRISEIFDKMDLCMEKLPNQYKGLPCEKVISLYEELRQNYESVKNNIISYSDDLTELIRKMQTNDKYLTGLFQNYTDETIQKTKSIIN